MPTQKKKRPGARTNESHRTHYNAHSDPPASSRKNATNSRPGRDTRKRKS